MMTTLGSMRPMTSWATRLRGKRAARAFAIPAASSLSIGARPTALRALMKVVSSKLGRGEGRCMLRIMSGIPVPGGR